MSDAEAVLRLKWQVSLLLLTTCLERELVFGGDFCGLN
jgi:hypothetical protein